jgi:hypothetical protein
MKRKMDLHGVLKFDLEGRNIDLFYNSEGNKSFIVKFF